MKSNPSVIIITGASSGIGAETARLFGKSGYRVVLAARDQEKLASIAQEIQSTGGESLAVQTDVTVLEEIHALVRQTIETYGRIDILFNNAGIGRLDWLEKLDPEKDVQALLETNLLAAIWMVQAVLPQMIERRSGHIINMASVAGLIAPPMYSIYSASKFGLRGFTEALRREAAIHGIRVSGIYPGGVKTSFAEESVSRRKTGIRTPRWLVLSTEDVARSVYLLHRYPRRTKVIPWQLGLACWFNLLFPGLVDRIIEQRFVHPERA
jgi:NADP-dependent 3-hydroxy acid dehydrogenase YdfG